MTGNSFSLTFRPDLQGLRALAVVLVILGHFEIQPFTGGFVGVDVFFVLSGYLISGLLVKEYQYYGRIAFLGFYARRLKRLFPALAVMIGTSTVAAQLLLLENEKRNLLSSLSFAATWTSNIFFSFRSYGYFDELANKDLFLHTWSLGVEEQFYLIWPVLLLFLFRASSNKTHRVRNNLMLLAGITLSISIYWTSVSATTAFYLMPARIWQFALGAFIFLLELSPVKIFSHRQQDQSYIFAWAHWFGIALIVASAVAFDKTILYPGGWSLVPTLGAALVIATGARHLNAGSWVQPLGSSTLVWIGDRSYSLYLWHWPVLMIGSALDLTVNSNGIVAMLAFTLLLAVFTYRLVELPCWRGSFSLAKSRFVLPMIIFLMSSAVATDFHIGRREMPLQTYSNEQRITQIRTDVPVIYRMQCDAWFAHAELQPCVFESGTPLHTVVLVGDSIGAQWFSAIREIYKAPEWRIVLFTKSSCPMVDEDYFYQRIGRVYEVCTEWRNKVLDSIESMRPDAVFIGSASTYGFSKNQWANGSARVLARASKAAKQVFVIAGTPSLKSDGPNCIARNLQDGGNPHPLACQEKTVFGQIERVADYLQRAARGIKNVRVLNLNNLVCPDGLCAAVSEEGVPTFRDSQHLTDSFVRTLVPKIALAIKAEHPID